ncbi:MAG: DUF1385 domain-containing protein, partial [Firmicutes bacterium]|nr:DUF1385 domain-containing protein [Bacillota bacterium]
MWILFTNRFLCKFSKITMLKIGMVILSNYFKETLINMTEKKVKKKKPKRAAIGGQALIEGVMMRGRGATALCCRNEKGDILLDVKRRNPKIRWWQRVPIVRGTIAFFDSMVIGVKSMTKAAEVAIPEDEEEIAVVENTNKPKKEGSMKGWIILSVVLGLVLGVGLFIVLPFVLSEFVLQPFVMDRHFPIPDDGVASPMRALYLALFEGGLRLVIFLLYLILVSLLKDIRRTFQYHGAEHRVINCYEKDLPMTVDNVQKCSSRHNRCGTTFLFFVIIFSILVFSLANWLIALIGITPESVGGNIQMGFVRLGIRLALLPFVAGLSYELLKLLAMLPDNWFTTILRAPGLALQRLTTYPPDRDMAEVALKSFLAVMAMEENADLCEIDFGQFRYNDLREEVAQKLKETNADAAE